MTTPLKTGSRVHGGDLTENGGWLGSPCRYVGLIQASLVRPTPRRYVLCSDGALRTFRDAELHHEADCETPANLKGRRL